MSTTTNNDTTTINNVNVITSNDTRAFGVPSANEFNTPTNFVILIVTILIVWVLINLFTRFVENMSYNTLGLDSSSSIHSLLVLLFMVVFLVATVWVIDKYGLISGGLTGSVVGIGAPVVDVNTSTSTTDNTTESSGGVTGRNGTFVSEK